MTDKKAMKLALDALELVNIEFVCDGAHHAKKDRHGLGEDCPVTMRYRKAITALKERLADHPMREVQRLGQEIEQEPVAWMDADGNVSDNNDHKCFPIPLYTTPPQRTEQEPVQVSPLEFVEMVMEKEHLIGKPIFWAEWPNKEKNKEKNNA